MDPPIPPDDGAINDRIDPFLPGETEVQRRQRLTETYQWYNIDERSVVYGPGMTMQSFIADFLFGWIAYTHFLTHCYQTLTSPLRIVFLSPLCLPFCRHCGKIFRDAETFQQHYGEKTEHEYCSSRKRPPNKGRSFTVNNVGRDRRKPVLKIHNPTEEELTRIFNSVNNSETISVDELAKMNVPLRIRMGDQHTEYTLTFDEVHQDFVDHDLCVSNRPNPRAVRFSSGEAEPADPVPVIGPDVIIQGKPPTGFETEFISNFLLKTSCIFIEQLQPWIDQKWQDPATRPTHLQLVACDETTAFGCTKCGSMTICGQMNRRCIARCFDMPARNENQQQRINYRRSYLVKAEKDQLVCEFGPYQNLQWMVGRRDSLGQAKQRWIGNRYPNAFNHKSREELREDQKKQAQRAARRNARRRPRTRPPPINVRAAAPVQLQGAIPTHYYLEFEEP